MTDLHPGAHVRTRGHASAVVMGASGTTVSYRELEDRTRPVAQLLHADGLRHGDHIAVMLENHPRYFEICWGALRSGMLITPINWHLTADEAGYIIEDCGAAAVFTSAMVADVAAELRSSLAGVPLRLMVDATIDRFDSYEQAIAEQPAEPLPDEAEGAWMFYSSGTTGRPKGIVPTFEPMPYGTGGGIIIPMMQTMYGFTPDTVYLCPAPLYHAAPIGWSSAVQRLGGTVVVMERFDAELCLQLIERHRITHAQFVPTHFIRMLKLPEEVRERYDHSSLEMVIHAAAPCPAPVKRQMIEWWGPIIHEYYAGSEGNGFCALNSQEALAHPGSVGKSLLGPLHVLDERGTEQPIGEPGQIWFESPTQFEYHNDPEKTADAYNDRGWSSLGDVGYLDDEGYLYLTDRVSHMIISGGVNIYPQEVENELALHPKVADAAVICVPNADLGEEVKAVVIAAEGCVPSEALGRELITHCRSKLAHYKCPVSVDFVDALPRLPTGKLLKRQLRGRYWPTT